VARKIGVVPAYNEEPTVAGILVKLHHLVDELVVVDDGSTDRTRAEIESVLPSLDHLRMLAFDENQGMSAAYYLAFSDLRRRMRAGELDPEDLVYTIDADGQHDLDVLDDLHNRMVDGLHDVESGYRIFRLGALADALSYYRGYKYSETVEVAVVLGRLGYEVRNDILVPVPVYRSRTRMVDVVIDLAAIPAAAFRVSARKPPGAQVPSLAKPLAVSGGLAVAGLATLRAIWHRLR
jgi:glycosyltransferase involved in cell wall biosynthesis